MVGLESRSAAWLAGAIAAIAIGSATWLAFSLGQRLTQALEQLNRSTNRMSNGDFTQPVAVMRSDELGDLQRTVDQMRKSLADTTINRNYLDNVLNSMTDAVFVARPGGMIRFTNVAAQRLTGADAAALNDRHVASLLQAPELDNDERLARACEVGEAVLRTESGQTIPVSFSGSAIDTAEPQFSGHIYVARDITDASAPSAASATWRATTRSPRSPTACSSSICCSRPSPAPSADARALRCCTWTWTASRK